MQDITPELDTRDKVGFTVRRVSEHLYPITTLQAATHQVHAERLVGELALTGEPEAIGLDYHTERRGKEVDVILTINGTDEVRVREAAQSLDEQYHGEPCYEEELDAIFHHRPTISISQ